MPSSVAPLRSIPVARECRSRWAPLKGGASCALASARCTRSPMAAADANPRCGASRRRKTRRVGQPAGRPLRKWSATASPTSQGSGRGSRRCPLPNTLTVPACQSKSSGVSAAASPPRSPRRAATGGWRSRAVRPQCCGPSPRGSTRPLPAGVTSASPPDSSSQPAELLRRDRRGWRLAGTDGAGSCAGWWRPAKSWNG